jgi:hypothetical protein
MMDEPAPGPTAWGPEGQPPVGVPTALSSNGSQVHAETGGPGATPLCGGGLLALLVPGQGTPCGASGAAAGLNLHVLPLRGPHAGRAASEAPRGSRPPERWAAESRASRFRELGSS